MAAKREDARERSIPDYLEGKEDWTCDDFIKDARAHGYTLPKAERFAAQYLWKLGKLELSAPELIGFRPVSRTPFFKDGGQVAFLYVATRGRKIYQFHTLAGRRVGPSQSNLAGAVVWQMKAGWVSV